MLFRSVSPGVEKQTLRAASVVPGFCAGGGGDEQVGVRGGTKKTSLHSSVLFETMGGGRWSHRAVVNSLR